MTTQPRKTSKPKDNINNDTSARGNGIPPIVSLSSMPPMIPLMPENNDFISDQLNMVLAAVKSSASQAQNFNSNIQNMAFDPSLDEMSNQASSLMDSSSNALNFSVGSASNDMGLEGSSYDHNPVPFGVAPLDYQHETIRHEREDLHLQNHGLDERPNVSSHKMNAKLSLKNAAAAIKNESSDNSRQAASFVVIGETLDKMYYRDKLVKTQKEFLEWTKSNLGFSKSTTYEYIISYRVYSDIVKTLPANVKPPQYQSHCQLLSKIDPENLASVWMQVSESCHGNITTAVLEDFLKRNKLRDVKAPASSGGKKRRAPASKKKKKKRRKEESDSDEITPEESDDNMNLIPWHGMGTKFNFLAPHATNDESSFQEAESMDIGANESPEHHNLERAPMQPTMIVNHPFDNQEVVVTPKKRQSSRHNEIPPSSFVSLPIDVNFIFEIAQKVVFGSMFDIVYNSAEDFLAVGQENWHGRIYFDLTASRPFGNRQNSNAPFNVDGIERLLQIIFTRYANKEYSEGIFVVRAEFGADWFTPILQHPLCILRQNNLKFQNGQIENHPDSFDSFVAFYMGHNVVEFCQQFRTVGYIPGSNCWSSSPSTTPISHQRALSLRSAVSPVMENLDMEFAIKSEFMMSKDPIRSQSAPLESTLPDLVASGNPEDLRSVAASVLCHMTQ